MSDEKEAEFDFEAGVARLVAREKEMLEPLESVPPIEIHALTGSLGAGALGSPKVGQWALRALRRRGPRRSASSTSTVSSSTARAYSFSSSDSNAPTSSARAGTRPSSSAASSRTRPRSTGWSRRSHRTGW